jgi:hypothetical protein
MIRNRLLAAVLLVIVVSPGRAQVDKTQLSLNVEAKYQENAVAMSHYTWQREANIYMKGELKAAILSQVSLGPDGKPVSQVIDKVSTTAKKPGLRGQIQKSEQEDVKKYVSDALDLVAKYIFMTKGQLVDLFDKGTISLISNNLQAQGFNFLVQGDNLKFVYNKNSLLCESQTVNTLMNGDPVKAQVTYTLVNGVNMVHSIELVLPAKDLTVTATNSQFAQKL